MEDNLWRPANTAILNQVLVAPPASVLGILFKFADESPEHVVAIPEWGEGETTWRVLAALEEGLLEITAHKEVDDWAGGGASGGDDGDGDTVSAMLYPWRSLKSVGFSMLSQFVSYDRGPLPIMRGVWTLTFDSGTVEINTNLNKNEGGRLASEGIVSTARGTLAVR